AYGLLKAWPALPHQLWVAPNGTEWLLWGVCAAALVALLEHTPFTPARTGPALAIGAAAGAVWLVLKKAAGNWSSSVAWLHVGGGAVAVVLLTLGHRVVLARAPSRIFPAMLFCVVLSVDAAVLTLGKSALLGQLCGAVAAALGAGISTALWRRPFVLTVADGTWLGMAHGLFLLAGVHLAYLPWSAAGCAFVAPLTLLLLRDGLGAKRPKAWALAASALVAVPCAAALWFALPQSTGPYGY
ncbi:MAG: hypothetical protein ABIP94_09735, partial [Planctomycetota bacterium]